MFPETLYTKTAQVLEKLASAHLVSDQETTFYLAGGTALALQLGHRKSIDLDFFTASFPKNQLLLNSIAQFSPKIIQEAPGTLDTIIDDVKVTFLSYPYPLLEEGYSYNNVRLASIIDIACMKLSAISSRGAKKDFIDLYFILRSIPLKELLVRFGAKFSGIAYNDLHILRSLIYFADADQDPDPDMLQKAKWEDIKNFLEKQVAAYL